MKKVALALILFFLVFPVFFAVQVKPSSAIAADSWVTKTPIPSYVSGLAAANGKIYGFARNATFEYTPASNVWETKSPMSLNIIVSAIAAFQNKIYTVGGDEGVMQVYDPATDTWETKTGMPTPRTQLEVNMVREKIYFIAGRTGGQYTTVDLNEVYDPVNDLWATKAPIPYPVVQYASAVINDKIYVMGGQDEFNDPVNLDLVQIYDPVTDTWSFGTPMPKVVWQAAAGAISGVLAPKRIYLIGGLPEKSLEGTNLDQVYNPENDSWTLGEPMPTSRFNLHAVVLNEKLYAMVGTPFFNLQGIWSSENEEYTPFGYGNPEPSPSQEPSPTPTSTPKLEPFPASLVFAASVGIALAVIGLFVFFNKRQKTKST